MHRERRLGPFLQKVGFVTCGGRPIRFFTHLLEFVSRTKSIVRSLEESHKVTHFNIHLNFSRPSDRTLITAGGTPTYSRFRRFELPEVNLSNLIKTVRRMVRLDQSGVTGLETAILHSASVTGALVLGVGMMTLGPYNSTHAPSTAMSGVEYAKSAMMFEGSVTLDGGDIDRLTLHRGNTYIADRLS